MSDVIEIEKPNKQKTARSSQTVSTPVGPADLLRHAVESGAGLDVLQTLIALRERDRTHSAHMAFTAAMVEFKKTAPTILKDKNVSLEATSYSHATLGGVCEAVIESLAGHGIAHSWDTVQPENGMIAVKCTLTHLMGYSQATTIEGPPDNSGHKSGVQQIGSTVTYLQRYTLLAVCGLATKDILDNDGRQTGGAPAGVNKETEEPTAALLAVAKAAANGGADSYAKFWAETGKDNRLLLSAHHDHHKVMAERVARPAPGVRG